MDEIDMQAAREGAALKRSSRGPRRPRCETTSRKGVNNTFGGQGGLTAVTSLQAKQIPAR